MGACGAMDGWMEVQACGGYLPETRALRLPLLWSLPVALLGLCLSSVFELLRAT